MKNLLSLLTGLVLALLISTSSVAQNTVNLSTFNKAEVAEATAYNAASPNKAAALAATKYNDRAVKHFNTIFPAIKEVQWYSDKKSISTFSMQDDVCTRVTYTKKGRWLHTFIYYDGMKLAPSIRATVFNEYPDVNILGVTEIDEEGVEIYCVNVQDAKMIKQLIVCNGGVSIYKEYERAD